MGSEVGELNRPRSVVRLLNKNIVEKYNKQRQVIASEVCLF